MNSLIESIVFAIMGAIVLVVGIIEKSGLEIIVLGSLILLAAIIFFVYTLINRDKNKKNE